MEKDQNREPYDLSKAQYFEAVAEMRQQSLRRAWAKIRKYREEIKISEKIIVERDRLISAIPACPVHSQCVPYAIEWVEKAVLMMRMLKAENKAMRRGMTGDYDLDAWLEFSTGAVQKDADRYRWLCDGNGYFMEEQMLCGHSNEKPEADRQIDIAMSTGERP